MTDTRQTGSALPIGARPFMLTGEDLAGEPGLD
jgi:hypothetical protein